METPQKWKEDELIVVMDFYFDNYLSIPDKNSSQIIELSTFLRRMKKMLYGYVNKKYRTPSGVYMKLMNFHATNEKHSGKGLGNASSLDKEIFNKYKENPKELKKRASIIREIIENNNSPIISSDDDISSEEGKVIIRYHRYRERNRKIVERKKKKVQKQTGNLICECCNFNFGKTYGKHGEGFIECHHITPLSEIKGVEKTKLDDLTLLCSNCHRMIHHSRPWLTLEQLRKIILANQN